MYIYMEYVKNVIYGIFGVSHFYMAYVWNKGFHTYIYGVSQFLCGIHMEYVHIYIYVEYVRNVKYGLYRVSQFYLECK